MYSYMGSWRNTNIPPKIRLIGKVLMNFIDRPTHFSQFLLTLIPSHSKYNHCSSCLTENLKRKKSQKVQTRILFAKLVFGVVWQKSDFWTKNRNFGPKKKESLLYSNHVLATTGKSCSKKKSAFAQIIKGGNVILGDFLG